MENMLICQSNASDPSIIVKKIMFFISLFSGEEDRRGLEQRCDHQQPDSGASVGEAQQCWTIHLCSQQCCGRWREQCITSRYQM